MVKHAATAQVYVGIGLLLIGMSLALYGSRTWGGLHDHGMATLSTIVVLGAFISFVIAETEPTKRLAAGVMIGFWLGLIDESRLWWGLTGAGLQTIAFTCLVIAERKALLQE